jgi:hypothetical protein
VRQAEALQGVSRWVPRLRVGGVEPLPQGQEPLRPGALRANRFVVPLPPQRKK